MQKILITNGSGTCGKDTFAEIMGKYVSVIKYSSIDFFKCLGILGFMKEEKGEKERNLLHNLKKAFVEYNNLPLILCKDKIEKFLSDEMNAEVLIIDIREPEEIEKIINIYPEIITVLITNDNAPVINTPADTGVFDYKYDYIIDNSYTLEVLEESVLTFLKELNFKIDESEDN